MLPTFVLVALPVETSVADTQTLLDACNRVFLDGECRTDGPPQPTSSLVAEVRWLGDADAQIVLRSRHNAQTRSSTRTLQFKPGDESSERYRSVGFAIGNLAGVTLAELRTREASPDAEGTAGGEPRAPVTNTEEAPAAAADPSPKPGTAQNNAGDAPSPPTPVTDSSEVPSENAAITPATPPAPAEPLDLAGRVRAGLLLGNGVDALRWGAQLGASAIVNQLWLLDASVAYALQANNAERLGAEFINVGVAVGVDFAAGSAGISLGLGPVLQVQQLRRAEARDGSHRWGVEMALQARAETFALAPFAELRLDWVDPTRIQLDATRAIDFGPWQFQVALGVALPGQD